MTAAPAEQNPAAAPKLIALVGPPNCGKSTLFNRLTGLRQKTGNYPGVTVEQKTGRVRRHGGMPVELIDLPGINSLNARVEDERVAMDVLTGKMPGVRQPDSILLVLDATALDRHLALAFPVISLGLPVFVALNLADELKARGGQVNAAGLSVRLGVPVALICARHGQGIEAIHSFLDPALPGKTRAQRVAPVQLPVLNDISQCRRWAFQTAEGARFRRPLPSPWTQRLDAIALHPVGGPLIFLAVLVTVFQSVSVAARPLQNLIEDTIAGSAARLGSVLPASPLRALLLEGVWAGVGSVLAFLPQILILFLLIGILEDSGYMPRAAVIADRTMARFGLQGKSFIPLLSGYACAIPAIMATRTIPSRRDRLATILVVPFMTCSARLPVYLLIVSAFVPNRSLPGPLPGTQALAMLGLYALGIGGALFTARLLGSTVLKPTASHFMMEMPPYRAPSVRFLALQLLDRARVFLRKAGTVILAVSVVLWLFARLPMNAGQLAPIDRSFAGMAGAAIEPILRPLGFNWKIGVGLITSLAAREVIVSTLGTLYGVDGTAPAGRLTTALHRDLTPGGAAALVVFFAFALQCFSTLAVVRRETGSWKWPAIQFVYMTAFAYGAAWVANGLVTMFVTG